MTDVGLTIDGQEVTVQQGTSLLEACQAVGIDVPTLCYLESLTPVSACRICVVEVEGSRVLVPACSRTATDGMTVDTGSDRVRHSRKMVLEFLASTVELSLAAEVSGWLEEYRADPQRFGPPGAAPEGHRPPGHHPVPNGRSAETVERPVLVDNPLYVRDYARCILCYKCVEACGVDAQNTFAITVAGRGFDSHISTEFDVPLPDSACVFCGNCIGVCPTGALMFRSEYELRRTGMWNEEVQTVTRTVCSFCGVGCNLELHVQDDRIVKVTSPLDHDVTGGHLCVKGRFGYQYIQNEPEMTPIDEVLRGS